ncbi:hypothetical protein cyc_03561 [Cyclospora cayetanensis]|uniref:Uncharacterized protein n=1 Tax=Cyclospora cayetanensis TaxID=88456 RepID=A0A1D3CW22_9EIME|nr:hypothetical protein cyc_03561 [Cyclospora cayetanensis]
MGDRSYPASETFITSAGRRDHPQARQLHEQLARTPHAPTCRRIEELTAHVRESCMFRAKALDAEALEIALKERNVHRDALEQTTVEECAKETESSANFKFFGSSSESTKLMTPEDKANRYFEQMLNARPQENTEFVSRWTELASAPSSSVQQTGLTERKTFAKDNLFTLPVNYSLGGRCKDRECLAPVEEARKNKGAFCPASTQVVQPALQAFKQRLRDAIRKAKGCLGFIALKAALEWAHKAQLSTRIRLPT